MTFETARATRGLLKKITAAVCNAPPPLRQSVLASVAKHHEDSSGLLDLRVILRINHLHRIGNVGPTRGWGKLAPLDCTLDDVL